MGNEDPSASPIPRTRPATGGEQIVTRLPWSDEVFGRLGPGSWLISPPHPPEITIRVAVALPSVVSGLGGNSMERSTLLRGQKRERRLLDILEHSPITEQLRRLERVWGGGTGGRWEAVGTGSVEFSELWFAPYGIDEAKPPLAARCGVATGWADGGNNAPLTTIQAALDIMINLTELDQGRRPHSSTHPTESSPVPAALSLEELAQILHALLDFPDVVVPAARSLIPDPRLDKLKLAEWVAFSGQMANRLIDLSHLHLLPRSSGVAQIVGGVRMEPYRIGGAWLGSWDFVADLVYEALEQGGYRDTDESIEAIRAQSY